MTSGSCLAPQRIRMSALLCVLVAVTGCAASADAVLRNLQSDLATIHRAQAAGGTEYVEVEPHYPPSRLKRRSRQEIRAALGTPQRCPSMNGYTFDGRSRVDECDRYPLYYLPARFTEGGGPALYLYYEEGAVKDARILHEM